MDTAVTIYLLAVYIHIIATVLWVGYCLFWTILIGPLERKFDPPQADHVSGLLRRTRWPPIAIPASYRLTLPGFGWATLALLGLTGALIAFIRGMPSPHHQWFFAIKLGLVLTLAFCQYCIARRPTPLLIYLTMVVTLSVVGLSALLVR
jgi:hypothetical protein